MEKKIYFKVYQDKESIDCDYFIESIETVLNQLPVWVKGCVETGDNFPVFEPIEMTEDEFLKLPEFTGY